jgi:hypothetical protein
MTPRRALVLVPLLLAITLLALGSAGLWAFTTRPGVPQRVTLTLPPDREVDLHIQPCNRRRPGWISLWYTEPSRQRLSAGWLRPLIMIRTSPPCAALDV